MEMHLVLKELAAKRKRYNRLQLLSQHQERVVASAGVARIHVGVVPHTRSQEVEIANISRPGLPRQIASQGLKGSTPGQHHHWSASTSQERTHSLKKRTKHFRGRGFPFKAAAPDVL